MERVCDIVSIVGIVNNNVIKAICYINNDSSKEWFTFNSTRKRSKFCDKEI